MWDFKSQIFRFEEVLEVKVIQAKDLLNDYLKINDANECELNNNHIYFIIWLNDNTIESKKSKVYKLVFFWNHLAWK